MPEFTWRMFTEFESAWNFTLIWRVFLFTAWSLWGFSYLAVSLCLRVGCRRRRSFFLSLTFATAAGGHNVMTETAWVSSGTLSMCLQLKNTLPLSFQRKRSLLFWLLVTDLLSTTSFRTLKFRVLIIWSTWIFTVVFNCWQFGSLLRAVSWSYKANTVWSWTEFSTFDLYNHSRILSESTSLTDNKVWSRLTSKSWTSSFCELFENKVESPCTASWAPVARKCS